MDENSHSDFQNQSADGGEITLTITDITKEEQINNCKKQVIKLLNGGGLDLLINNAGVLTPGPMEVLSLSAVHHEFEVNVFWQPGHHPCLFAFITSDKRSHYSNWIDDRTFSDSIQRASKAAMEAFADVYRTEGKSPTDVAIAWDMREHEHRRSNYVFKM